MLVACYLAMVVFFTLTTGITYPILVLFAASVGVGAASYGLVTGFGLSANAIGRPLAGRLSDRLGRRGFIVTGLLLLTIAQVIYAITPRSAGFVVLAAANVLVGLGAGMFWPTLNATVVEVLPRQRREGPLGLVTSTQSVSIAVGAAAGGTVARLLGYRSTFLLAAALLSAALILAGFVGRSAAGRPPPRHEPPPKGRLTAGTISPSAAFFLLNVAIGAVVTFLPLYAHVELGSSPETIGILFSVVLIARAAGSLLASVLATRGQLGGATRPRLVVAEVVLAAAALALTPVAGFAALAVCQVLAALVFGGVMVTLVAMAADAAPQSALGSAISTIEAGGFVGSVIGSAAAGLVFEAAPRLLFPLAGAVALAGAAALTPVLHRQGSPRPPTGDLAASHADPGPGAGHVQ